MIEVSVDFLYGVAVGIIFADEEDKAENNLVWAMLIYLGPITIAVNRFKEDV